MLMSKFSFGSPRPKRIRVTRYAEEHLLRAESLIALVRQAKNIPDMGQELIDEVLLTDAGHWVGMIQPHDAVSLINLGSLHLHAYGLYGGVGPN